VPYLREKLYESQGAMADEVIRCLRAISAEKNVAGEFVYPLGPDASKDQWLDWAWKPDSNGRSAYSG
jgi:hypothetical protein